MSGRRLRTFAEIAEEAGARAAALRARFDIPDPYAVSMSQAVGRAVHEVFCHDHAPMHSADDHSGARLIAALGRADIAVVPASGVVTQSSATADTEGPQDVWMMSHATAEALKAIP